MALTALAILALAVLPVASLPGDPSPAAARAATGSDFRAGNIISDALFFDGSAMSEAEVQAFLEMKRPTCATGATCLKSYVTATTNQPAEPGLCGGYTGRPAETAAQIIARVGQSCGISQKVLLVLLQKEQGLVTAASPSATQYSKATGFACPDNAACDAQYLGFFNQVYRAARQFKRYAAAPASWTYRAGRTSAILFNPNQACGSASVSIENQATAGLYTYTPYQPNAAALATLYSAGDSCSAYGNRNFWRDYTDWFGSTQVGANLVRSTSSPVVYLVTPEAKYPIDNVVTLASLAVLGSVGYVPQSFLDARATGPTLGRFVRDRGGSIYLLDTGRLFHVTDCAMLEDWGATCDAYQSMALSESQMRAFTGAGTLSTSFVTPEGKRFWVNDGARHEVADGESLALASPQPATPTVPLSEQVAAALPYGAPLVRDNVVVHDRASASTYLSDSAGRVALAPGLVDSSGLSAALPQVALDAASIALMPAVRGTSAGLVRTASGDVVALSPSGGVRLSAGQLASLAATAPQVRDAVIAALAPIDPSPQLFVRSTASPALSLVDGTSRRAVDSMETVYALTGSAPVGVAVLSQTAVDSLTVGAAVLQPGRLVKAVGSPDISLVDGATSLVHLPSFAVAQALGLSGYTEVPVAALAPYSKASDQLSTVLRCGSRDYIGSGGRLVPLSATALGSAGLAPTLLAEGTCATRGSVAAVSDGPIFVRTAESAALYVAAAGTRRPVASMDIVQRLAGTQPVVALLSQETLAAMPVGSQVLTPGVLVKEAGAAEVYLVDGTSRLHHLTSFEVSDALGSRGFTEVPSGTLADYQRSDAPLSGVLACGGSTFAGSAGQLVSLPASVVAASGAPTSTLDPRTCSALRHASQTSPGPLFLRGAGSSTVFLASDASKRQVSTMDTVYALAGGRSPVIAVVDPAALAAMATGPGL